MNVSWTKPTTTLAMLLLSCDLQASVTLHCHSQILSCGLMG